MSDNLIFKKVFQKYWVQQNRDRSYIPLRDEAIYYDGVHPHFDVVCVTSTEESFLKSIKDPLYSVSQSTLTIVVEQKGDKISAKIFTKHFLRKVGKSYFQLSKNIKFVTVNIKTGNIYFGELINYQKKRKFVRRIKSNSFIEESFNSFRISLKNLISEYNVDENTELTNEFCRIFINSIDKGVENLSIGNRLFKFYLDKKNIKYPNNFRVYSKILFGDFRKILKKSENKIVDAFMLHNNIQGKKVKKVLHTVNNLNLSNYKAGFELFGTDWMNQDENLLVDVFNNKIEFVLDKNIITDFNKFASLKERRKAFLLYKLFNSNNEIDGWTLRDHFTFYVQLKRYGDTEVEWKSNHSSEFFRQEHLDWSDKLSFYKKGHYQRIYPESFFNTIKNFEHKNLLYYPILLTNTTEYNSESSTQSNCVRSYIGSPSSIIISLRKNSESSEDRLTVEYRIEKAPNLALYYINRVQTKAKFNSQPEEDWTEPLKILDTQVDFLVKNKRFETYRLKKKCANGVELESDTHFDEEGRLVWSYKAIDNESYFLNFL